MKKSEEDPKKLNLPKRAAKPPVVTKLKYLGINPPETDEEIHLETGLNFKTVD